MNAADRGTARGLEQRLLRRVEIDGIEPQSTVVVGFSGGADSLCLATALRAVGPRRRLNVVLHHVDHRIRSDSARDAEHARYLAARLGLPIHVSTLDIDVEAQHRGVGLEEAARRERFLAFAERALADDRVVIALGHHQDDQAETVLLHLLRGSGLAGAAGMRSLSCLDVPWWDKGVPPRRLVIWRPLIGEHKATVAAYVARLGITPIQDSSNDDWAYRRNRIRHDVLPAMERAFPGAAAALARYGEIAGGDESVLEAIMEERAASLIDDRGDLDVDRLQEVPIAIQRRVIREWLRRMHAAETSFERIESIRRQLVAPQHGWFLETGGGWGLTIVGQRLCRVRREDVQAQARDRFPAPTWLNDEQPPVQIGLARGSVRIGAWLIGADVATASRVDGAAGFAPLAPTEDTEVLRIGPVTRSERFARTGTEVGEWFRRHRVSYWLRDEMIGVWSGERLVIVLGLPVPGGPLDGFERVVWWRLVGGGNRDVEPSKG